MMAYQPPPPSYSQPIPAYVPQAPVYPEITEPQFQMPAVMTPQYPMASHHQLGHNPNFSSAPIYSTPGANVFVEPSWSPPMAAQLAPHCMTISSPAIHMSLPPPMPPSQPVGFESYGTACINPAECNPPEGQVMVMTVARPPSPPRPRLQQIPVMVTPITPRRLPIINQGVQMPFSPFIQQPVMHRQYY